MVSCNSTVLQYAEVLNTHQHDKVIRLHRLYAVIQDILFSVKTVLRNGQSRHKPSLPSPSQQLLIRHMSRNKNHKKATDNNNIRRQETTAFTIFRQKNTGAAIKTSPLPQFLYCLKKQYVQRLEHIFWREKKPQPDFLNGLQCTFLVLQEKDKNPFMTTIGF